MKKKPIIISTILSILAVLIYFVANPKIPAIKDSAFHESVETNHQLLRLWFPIDINELENIYSELPETSLRPEILNKEMLGATFRAVRENTKSDINEYADWVSSNVNDERIKNDAIRAEEFFYLAGKNEDILALGYAYMIYHDLDVQLNNYNSNYDLFGVTELQGRGGKHYDRMIQYYKKLKSND